jgi:hypothetical protein
MIFFFPEKIIEIGKNKMRFTPWVIVELLKYQNYEYAY